MDYQTCFGINMPLAFLNIMTSVFYIFCLACPRHGERIKQPLKLLLWSLICWTITYLMASSVTLISQLQGERCTLTRISFLVSFYILKTSMTSSVWLNFFYYTQIVPAQRVLFIWIKKNIKPIIYCIWLFERIYTLFDFISLFLYSFPFYSFAHNNNFTTVHHVLISESSYLEWLVAVILVSIEKAHFSFCLCVMLMSNGCTAVYLCRHMWRMVADGQPFCPRFYGQVRVAVSGILQGFLYSFCAVWTMTSLFSVYISSDSINLYIDLTVINLYMSITTFNLGAGQSVFRQRATDIWITATQWCKMPKEEQTEQGGRH